MSFGILLLCVILFGYACNSENEKHETPVYDTTPTGPAPNNTNATFPSMSDSAVSNPDTSKSVEVE